MAKAKERETRTEIVSCRLLPSEVKELQLYAKRMNTSVSDLLARCAREGIPELRAVNNAAGSPVMRMALRIAGFMGTAEDRQEIERLCERIDEEKKHKGQLTLGVDFRE